MTSNLMTNTFTMGGRLRGAVAAVAVIVLPLVGGLAACGTEDSLLEATDDAFAVLDGVVVVLDLGLRLQHRQSCPSP